MRLFIGLKEIFNLSKYMKKTNVVLIKRINYTDSVTLNEQTDEIAEVEEIIAVGFIVSDTKDSITIARELIGREYRGQLAIPKRSIIGIGEVGIIQEDNV